MNNFVNADKIQREYCHAKMLMIRKTFDLAKNRLEDQIGVIKLPLQQTTKKYVVMSLSSTPNKNKMIDVNTLTKN